MRDEQFLTIAELLREIRDALRTLAAQADALPGVARVDPMPAYVARPAPRGTLPALRPTERVVLFRYLGWPRARAETFAIACARAAGVPLGLMSEDAELWKDFMRAPHVDTLRLRVAGSDAVLYVVASDIGMSEAFDAVVDLHDGGRWLLTRERSVCGEGTWAP